MDSFQHLILISKIKLESSDEDEESPNSLKTHRNIVDTLHAVDITPNKHLLMIKTKLQNLLF